MPADQPPSNKPAAGLSDYLAAERTFLAWIRTGLALMGFGFVIARFGIFLQQFQILQPSAETSHNGFSLWFGTAVVIIGVAVNIFAGWHHVRLIAQLNRGVPSHFRPSMQALAVALLLALIGLAMAIYLASVRNSSGINKETSMLGADKGIINVTSTHSVDQTVEKIRKILEAKGVMLFVLVDHSGEAEKVGMKMPPTKLLIFGSPKAGTPIMQSAPSSALDLPLKILVREDQQHKVWISYNSPEYLQWRHGFSADLLQNISVLKTLATSAAE
jgi:uncharacterized protein (DUF302 family)/uncharacterized membrane protein YidH (DUF202 family)